MNCLSSHNARPVKLSWGFSETQKIRNCNYTT